MRTQHQIFILPVESETEVRVMPSSVVEHHVGSSVSPALNSPA